MSEDSLWAEIASWPEAEQARLIASLSDGARARLMQCWPVMARPAQLAPPGDWRVWLVMAGRGFGKTRCGAEWVRNIAERDGAARIALVGGSLHEARAVMVEGESGLLSIAPASERPAYYPALRKLIWRSGAVAQLFGAAEPDSLRGAQFSHGWADEIAKWPFGIAAWDNLNLALRLGSEPRLVATTTPRPVALVRRLLADPGVRVTRGATTDNHAHLPEGFIDAVLREHAGTRLGRQEILGELVEDVAGALWTRDLIERCRVSSKDLPTMERIVVAVDPPASVDGDACGIVAAGLGADGRAYMLGDESVAGLSPEGWARAVAGAVARYGADRVVAEANNGGAMVESVLRAADDGLPVSLVHASRGKSARAEPVAALFEGGRACLVGGFTELEDQMCGLIIGGDYAGPGRSPDRADAMVWAFTELMLGKRGQAAVRVL